MNATGRPLSRASRSTSVLLPLLAPPITSVSDAPVILWPALDVAPEAYGNHGCACGSSNKEQS
eukprot:47916-Eustigmatos_ZCMA.PRE.1